ncbi:COG1361 S-layer family protein [Halorutilales archaeon Cl-col2-1]
MNSALRHGAVVLAVVVSAVVLVSAPALGAQESVRYDEPDLMTSIGSESNVVDPGETTRLRIDVQNRGSTIAETPNGIQELSQIIGNRYTSTPGAAITTRVDVRSGDAPVDIRSDTQSAGTVTPSRGSSVGVMMEVDENATPGTYRLPVEIDYEYVTYMSVDSVARDSSYQIIRNEKTETEYITVRVDSTFDLDVVDMESESLRVDSEGSITATVRNEGHETAHDATLQIVDSSPITSEDNSKSVGSLEPGQEKTFDFRVKVGSKAVAGRYPVNFRVSYEDENGVARQSDVKTGTAEVDEEIKFDMSASSTDLYVNSMGQVNVEVTNEADTSVDNAKLVMHPTEPFVPVSTTASLGDLEAGETANASFKAEVVDRAVPQDYSLDFAVEYYDYFDEKTTSDVNTVSVDVGPEMTFDVLNTPEIEAGATDTVEVEIENTGEGVYRDAVARMNVDTPFSTDDDTAYIGDLEPGESTTVTYKVSVASSATPKEYSVDMAIKYDNAFGDKVVTDIQKAPVRVTQGGGGLLGSLLGLVGL